ncbi:alpha/beta fold hydrolase [Pseudooceanicola sp. MF1-13]|uniref:alpha/beta fold hydrolase n=1 Tax=Pseudooceanicola sp. MF1-13 TaxID=3379095 RepID=UPI003891E856
MWVAKAMLWLLILIAIVVAATGWRAISRTFATHTAYPPEGQFITVNGHQVHYVQKGEGPDLVLIHGASGNTRDFTFSLVDQLTDRYRVTVFDRPGLGYTPPLARRGVTLADQAKLLQGAAVELQLNRPIVLGQSFGGAVAMAWALAYEDRIAAVVNVAGATYPWQGELDKLYATMARPVIGPIVAWGISAWVSRDYVDNAVAGVFRPQSEPQGYAEYFGPGLVLRPFSAQANAQQRTDMREELRVMAPQYASLSLPIEIVHGDADDIVGLSIHSEPMEQDVASADLTVLDGIGHMPQHVAQPQVIAAIDRAAQRAGLR